MELFYFQEDEEGDREVHEKHEEHQEEEAHAEHEDSEENDNNEEQEREKSLERVSVGKEVMKFQREINKVTGGESITSTE